MTTIFPPLCFNFIMPNLRRRADPSAPTEAPRVPVRPSRSLCRNLFGTVDHEENMKFVKRELSRIAEEKVRRWNFDFVNEKPLEGKIKWRMADSTKVPTAYTTPTLTAKISQPSTSSQKESAAAESPSDKTIVPIEPAEVTATTTQIIKPVVCRPSVADAPQNNTKSTVKSKTLKRKRSQTRITDYLRSCKRPRSADTTESEKKSSRPVLKRAKMSL